MPAADLDAAKAEPRILFHLAERNLRALMEFVLPEAGARVWTAAAADRSFQSCPRNRALKIDWSISLGAGNVAPNMFPAKYSFDINATPSCTNDYVVYSG